MAKIDRIIEEGIDHDKVFDKFLEDWNLVCIKEGDDTVVFTFVTPLGKFIEIRSGALGFGTEGFTIKEIDSISCDYKE